MRFSGQTFVKLILAAALAVSAGLSPAAAQDLRGLERAFDAAVVVDGALVALTEEGPIVRSVDGGANFHTLRAPTPPDTLRALAAAERIVVAGGSSGLLLRSDFGVAPTVWTEVDDGGTLGSIQGIAHNGNGTWVAVGGNGFSGGILVSSDGGISWSSASDVPAAPLYAVAWNAVANEWIAVGGDGFDGAIFRSANAQTWTPVPVPAGTGNLLAVAVDEAGNVLAVGEGGAMLSSEDDGATFEAVAGISVSEDLLTVVSSGPNQWVVAGEGGVAVSIDAGESIFLFEPDPSEPVIKTLLVLEGSVLFLGRDFIPAPEISPAGGTYADPVSVTLSGAPEIYYTLDGSLPTVDSTLFTTPFDVATSAMVRAVAWDADAAIYSPVASAYYTIESAPDAVAAPSISPVGGTYVGSVVVTLSADPGVSIYYTTNGSAPTTASQFYAGPFTLTSSATVRAVAWDWSKAIYSDESSASYTVAPAAPGISPAGGDFVGPTSITLSAASGAAIFYTLDGSEPDGDSTLYEGPFTLDKPTTVKAVARAGGIFSDVSTSVFTIAPTAPAIGPAAGTHVGPVTVTLTAQPGAEIFYTVDGTTPSEVSTPYTGPFAVSASSTVRAIARAHGVNSPVASASYLIAPFAPQISPVAGTYFGPVNVTIEAEAGTEIFYTVDGSTPTTGSEPYVGPFSITNSLTVRAIASRGGVSGPVATTNYTIGPQAPSISPAPGTYVGPVSVTLNAQGGAAIYYTLDGSAPTTGSILYAGPFSVATSGTVRAMARANGVSSPVASAAYVIAPFAPEISPGEGTYVGSVAVTLSAQPGATIYYTLNGANPTTASAVYSGPFNVTSTSTVKTMARLNGVNGPVASRVFTVAPPAPTISPAGGTHVGPVSVSLSGQSGATLYYTLDGSEPTTGSTVYSGPFNVAVTSTVKAMARRNNVNGPVASSTFTIAPFAPTISPAAGTYVGPISVSVAAQTGATIYYTVDGSEPTTASPVYAGAIPVSVTSTVKAMARLNGVNGPVASAAYTIAPTAPTISPEAGMHVGPATVTITAQPGATIYYTLNGSDPTTSSPVYSNPLTVSTSSTVKAMARFNGVNGPIASASYTIAPFAPVASPEAGSYVGPTRVTLTAQSGATIFYTLDGSNPTTSSATYTTPFTLNAPTTVKAMARANNVDSPTMTADYIIAPNAPAISPAAGTYVGPTQVTLSAQGGATIFYTVDGSEPTTDSAVYSGPLTISESATIRAMARAHSVNSPVSAAAFTIAPFAPEITPAAGTHVGPISVSMTAQAGATIYYTVDGTEPTTESAQYNGPFTVSASATVKARARLNGVDGPVATAAYTIAPFAPEIAPEPGTYVGPLSVTLAAPPGATIYYTTDGSNPTTTSAIYATPFTILKSSTVKAMARANGVNGPVASAEYFIAPFAPVIAPASGTYVGPITISLSAQAGATIFYTTNGAEPTTASSVYSGSFTLAQSATVKAMARLNNVNGPVASAAYTIAPFAPEISPAGGTYVGSVSVMLSAQPGAEIYYTIDGTQPTTGSSLYVAPFTVSSSSTVIAMARVNGVNGPTASASYTIAPFAVEISPAVGTYVGPISVTLSAQGGATIYYTVDGSDPTTGSAVYGAPFTVSESATVKAMARLNGVNGPVASASYVIAPLAPTISPASGTYVGSTLVTLSAHPDASIFYTLDGSEPTPESLVYSGPFTVSESATVKAMARLNGVNGPGASASYTIAPLAPVFSPAPGTYTGPTSVTLSAQAGATIFYTVDGSEPTASSAVYSEPLTVSRSATVKAMARLHEVNGPVASAAYAIVPLAPVISPEAGTYYGAVNVSISAPEGAAIHYTINGEDPTVSSPVYTSPIRVSNGATVKAIARRDGLNSAVASAAYSVLPLTVDFTPAGGSYAEPVAVELSAPGGAEIYYTLDGSDPTTASPVYLFPIEISVSTTVKAMARLNGVNGPVASARYNIAPAAPLISPASGAYVGSVSVTISTQAGATVYYTLNGSEPTTGSPVYSSPIPVSDSATVKAMARLDGLNSAVSSAVYTISPLAVEVSPPAGTYPEPVSVEMSGPAGAEIYYTVDGSEPTTASAVYSGPIKISVSTTVKAVAHLNDVAGPVTTAVYRIAPGAPTIAPGTGTYVGQAVVTLGAQEGAAIHYTLDGTEPTAGSAVYSGPITISTSTTLKAMARLDGVNGPTASANYTIAPPAPEFSPSSGTYEGSVSVTLSAREGALIYYTTDGTQPSVDSNVYTVPVLVSNSTTIRAMARLNGVNGPVASADYAIVPLAPVISPGSGPYAGAVSVTISAQAGSTIYYTLDGSEPTTSSPVYTGPFSISTALTVKAMARLGELNSEIASASYTFSPLVVGISPGSGTYSGPVSVVLTAPFGAAIHYTLDGSNPTTSSPVYSSPVEISESTTVRAMARLSGVNGPVSSAHFVIESEGETEQPYRLAIDPLPNGFLRLTLSGSEEGKHYQLQTSEDLKNWSNSGAPIAGTGAALIWEVAAEGERAFFRVSTTTALVAAPVISPDGGMFAGPVTVTIDGGAGAQVFYTLDGSVPTTDSTLYAGPFEMAVSGTVRAVSVSGGILSSVSSATFVIEPSSPSQPRLTIVPETGGKLRLTLSNAVAGVFYQLQTTMDLAVWSDIEAPKSGAGGDLVWSIADDGSRRFFRVVEVPAPAAAEALSLGILAVSSSELRLTLTGGESGSYYQLQTSVDLREWFDLEERRLGTGRDLIWTVALSDPARFYRVVAMPE